MKNFTKIVFLILAINLLSINIANAVLTNTAPTKYQKKQPATSSQRQYNSKNDSTDFTSYMNYIQHRIKSNWYPPKDNESSHVTALFTVSKNGNLLDAKITQSSGNSEADRAALQAIYNTAPFRPLPSTFSGSSVDIQFNFDYNVRNDGY